MNRIEKKIAYLDGMIAEEELPYRYVYYPGHYGSFLGFKEDKSNSIYSCSCSYEAIEHYIEIKLLKPKNHYSDPNKEYLISNSDFPLELVENLRSLNIKEDINIMNNIKFRDKLCHECNKVIPSYEYCHEMYGGIFKRTYGWYINKQKLEFGIDQSFMSPIVLTRHCPEEVKEILEELKPIKKHGIWYFSTYLPMDTEKVKIWRKIDNISENEVRLKFGHKKIGEAWTSETVLYYLVKEIYKNTDIERHYKPKFLNGLELDIYIPKFKLGIEYQGIQHFEPIKHWGGERGLLERKEKDKTKKKLCDNNNINLLYIKYDENLDRRYVENKIEKILRK